MPAPIDVQVSSSRPAGKLRRRPGLGRTIPGIAGCGRGLHPAGHELPRLAAGCQPRPRRRIGPDAERRRGQRHHGAEFQSDDRAQLLGGPEDRKRLFPDGPVLRARSSGHPQRRRPDQYPAARSQPEGTDHARDRRATQPYPDSHGGGPLPDPKGHRRLCNAGRRGPRKGCGCHPGHFGQGTLPRHGARRRCGAWCRA